MFSTVRAGLCILVQIHPSLFSPSCQTQSRRRSSTAPYSHEENPGPPYQCEESHQLGPVFFFHSSSKISVTEHLTDPLTCERFLIFFPNVELHVAPPSLQVKTGAGPAAVTSLPGFATQGRNGNAEKEVEVGTLHQAIAITIVFSEYFSRCPQSY